MNRIYRLVFNRELGLVQVASELNASAQGSAGSAGGACTATLPALRFAIYVALGFVMTLPAFAQSVQGELQGRIVGDPNAPAHQRPSVLEAPNGVPLVNITTPSAAGVSRNQYSQFDVGSNGAILNNARTNTQTQLGGWVQGNPWLATGTARVILNEVNSSAPSYLRGYVEVAGDRAEVIIANPAGIQVNGGGFINASRATLTTGRPIVNGGALDGYRVEGSGAIRIDGAGLGTGRADYTDLIARSVQLNAGLWANRLKVTAGANTVSADHAQVAKIDDARGTAPQFALDVSALGGMYANHIALVGTESGMGVRNAGAIGAQVGDLVVTIYGRLENSGALQAQQDTRVSTSGGIANAGTLSAARGLVLNTAADVNNDGGTINARRIEVNAQSLENRGGAIEQTGVQALAINAGALSNRQGGRISAPKLSGGGGGGSGGGSGNAGGGADGGADEGSGVGGGNSPGQPALADGALNIAGALDNDGGRIEAGGIDLSAANGLDNDGGHLRLRELHVRGGDLGNAAGELIVDGAASVHVDAIDNDAGRLSVAGSLTLDAQSLSNRAGTLSHSGTQATTLDVAGRLDNSDGTIASNANRLTLAAGVFVNERGQLQHAGARGLQIHTGMLSGAAGTIATTGAATADAATVDHRGATLSATQVDFTVDGLDNRGGRIIATGEAANTLAVRGSLDNGDDGLIASNGDLTLRAATLGNAGGTVQHAGTGALAIEATTLDGSGGTLVSNGALSIAGQTTNLRGGDTTAQRIVIDTGHLTTADGTLTALGTDALDLRARVALDNTAGTIQTNGALAVQAGALTNTNGTLSAAGNGDSVVAVGTVFDNTGGTVVTTGATTIQSDDLLNRGGMLQLADNAPLTITVADRLDNSAQGVIAADGDLAVSATTLDNTGGAIQHAGSGILNIAATTLDGAGGTIGSNGELKLRGETTNLRGGSTVARKISIDTGALTTADGTLTATGTDVLDLRVRSALDNRAGDMATNGALRLQAGALTNADGTITAVGTDATQVRVTGVFDNVRGTLAAAGDTTLHAGSLVNAGGTVHAAQTAALQATVDGRLDNTEQGKIVAGGASTVQAQAVDNRNGTINAGDTLGLTVAQALDNRAGVIAGSNALMVRADTLDNRNAGLLASIENAIDVATVGRTDNAGGTIQAAGNVTVASSGLGNAGGSIVGANTHVDTRQQALDNATGTIASTTGTLDLRSGALDNDAGLLQSAGAMTVDTAGQRLTNTRAGTAGGLISGGTMTLASGDLDNRAGVVFAQGDLTARTAALDNSGAGQFGGAANVLLDGTALHNTGGTVQAGRNLTATLGERIDNTAGLIVAADTLTANAGTILNRDTLGTNPNALLGLQGDTVTLNAGRIDNHAGQIAADVHIGIAGTGVGSGLDNTGGSVSSAGSIGVTVGTLTNTDGTLLSGATQTLTANAMTGDGRVLSQGDLTIALQQGFINTGQITANGKADIRTAGTLTNRSTIQAGDLTVRGANVDNTATGEISGDRMHVVASNTVTNRGLIDGGETSIDAATIDNVGTGRIYGDHVALQAGIVRNREETVGGDTQAATIAARTRLDIGARTVANREQALIFSAGSGADALNIGGALDVNAHAIGRADFVHNASATIESLGGLTLATTRLRNSNEHFATTEVQVSGPVKVLYIQPEGDPNQYDVSNFVWENWSRAGRYRWKNDPPPNETGVLGASPVPRVGEQSCTGSGATEQCTRVPGADYLRDDPAWAYFGVTAPDPEPTLGQYPNQAAFDSAHAAWVTETNARYSALDVRIETYNDTFASAEIRRWTQFDVTQTEYETQVTRSAPALIRAGGSMWLYGDELVNDKSQIVVGGVLAGDLGNLQNVGAFGTRRVHATGTSQFTYSRWRGGFKRYHEREWDPKIAYTPADEITTIGLSIHPVGGSGYQVGGRNTGGVNGNIAGSGDAGTGTGARQITEVTAQVTTGPGPGAANGDSVTAGNGPDGASGKNVGDANANGPTVIRTIAVDTSVPTSSLFRQGGNVAGYLIETDARFADYRNWLSSDYLLGALGYDPASIHKRLGDGYYEQRLVREQIGQLTGRRFLDGYASDEAQYRALLEHGATFAKQWNLRPGVALSAEQMAQLTSDIVWLVEQTVTLPDGTTTTALVPQVYVRVRPGDLDGSGTLISADVIDLDLKGDLINSGTIAGRTAVQLSGENLHNLGGRITGDAVALRANTDINNIGGTIDAGSVLLATAGRDINVVTTTHSDAKQAGLSDFSRTNIDRVAGLYVTNPGGTLAVTAGRDANLIGAQVVNAGAGGQTLIGAGRNVNLGTVTVSEQENNVRDADNYLKQGYTQEVGTNIATTGDVRLQAGGDINTRAANVSSEQGTLAAMAQGDVNITHGENTANFSEGRKHTHSGALNTTTTTTRDSVEETTAQGSTFSGHIVAVKGENITVTGSNVVSDVGTTMFAEKNLTVEAAYDTVKENNFRQKDESGVFGSGGASVTAGSRSSAQESTGTNRYAVGSMIGSLGGDTTLVAKNGTLHVQGSTVSSLEGSTTLLGQSVNIEEAYNTTTQQEKTRFKQSGVTVAVSAPVLDAAMATYDSAKTMGQSKNDRVNAMAAANTAYNAYQAAGAATSAMQSGGQSASVSITYGQQQSESEMNATSREAVGSNINGKNTTIRATGAGDASTIRISGSEVYGRDSTTLYADGNIDVVAAQNTSEQHSENSSSGWNAGVAVSYGSGGWAAGVTAGGNVGKGSSDGKTVTHTNAHVGSGGTTTVTSGGTLTLSGGQITGEQVAVDVKSLVIESLQDTQTYDSKQMNASAQVTAGYGVSVSASYNQSKVKADYASVNEQSGILAGDGGYSVKVKDKTELKGGIITSTEAAEAAGRNSFSTGTLQISDIENHANYEGSSFGLSGSMGVNGQGEQGEHQMAQGSADGKAGGVAASKSVGFGQDKDRQSSTTHSGINTKNITITDAAGQAATGKSIDQIKAEVATTTTTDTVAENSGALTNKFDAAEVQKELDLQVQVTQAFDHTQQGVRGEINTSIDEARQRKEDAAAALTNDPSLTPEQKAALLVAADDAQKDIERLQKVGVLVNVIASGLASPAEGAGGIAVATLAPGASYLIGQHFKENAARNVVDNGGRPEEGSTTHLLAHALLGAVVAGSGGDSALIGGLAAVGAEAAAPALGKYLFGKEASDLSAGEKETIGAIVGVGGVVLGSLGKEVSTLINSSAAAQNAANNNWGEVGHYSTMATVLYLAGFSEQDAKAVALAAWAPDTDKRNAITVDNITNSSNPSDEQQRIHLLDGEGSPKKVVEKQRELGQDVATILALMKQYENNPAAKARLLSDPETQRILHSFGDSYAHVERDGTHYPSGKGHGKDSVRGPDPDNPNTHQDAYSNYAVALYEVAAATSGRPLVTGQNVANLAKIVAGKATEESQKAALENAIGAVGGKNAERMVNSPVSECFYLENCTFLDVGAPVRPEIQDVYGVRPKPEWLHRPQIRSHENRPDFPSSTTPYGITLPKYQINVQTPAGRK